MQYPLDGLAAVSLPTCMLPEIFLRLPKVTAQDLCRHPTLILGRLDVLPS